MYGDNQPSGYSTGKYKCDGRPNGHRWKSYGSQRWVTPRSQAARRRSSRPSTGLSSSIFTYLADTSEIIPNIIPYIPTRAVIVRGPVNGLERITNPSKNVSTPLKR